MFSTPRTTSSSRTTRVIEELQDSLENIGKELETTKAQVKHKHKGLKKRVTYIIFTL
jgi:biotin operon repressor